MSSGARSTILRIARVRFLERGFPQTSLDAVRQEAGVSNGSLFHFFPTKSHLARALYVEAVRSYQAALLAVLADNPKGRDGVKLLVEAHVDWVLGHHDDARVLVELREATSIEGEPIDGSNLNGEAFAVLRAWLKKRVDSGEMQALSFEVWMALVFAPVLMLTTTWAKARTERVPAALRRALVAGAWAAVRRQPK